MKDKNKTLVLLLCSLVILTGSGCCTIMSGGTQEIPISSTPSGAKVTADNGTSIVTPGSMVLKRKTPHTLVAEYPGHEQKQQKLEKKLNNWVWGNILIGGIIGLAIDMVSGAVNELKPKEVHFQFEVPDEESSEAVSILYKDDEFQKFIACRLSRIYKIAA